MYSFWWFRNEKIFEVDLNIMEVVEKLNQSTKEFSEGISYNPSFPSAEEKLWFPHTKGWTKINSDVAFKKGTAALAMVTRDVDGLLIFATTKLINAPSIFYAEI